MNSIRKIDMFGSKSISNRVLLLDALYHNETKFTNLSISEDTQLLQKALLSEDSIIDIHHAGTAMRFLTSYFSMQEGRKLVLTGSDRMKERPIEPLVESLKKLGANISYLEKEGYPPLKISGYQLEGGEIVVSSNMSSQYISALCLIAPKMEQGLRIKLEGEVVSRPYIDMTLSMLKDFGVKIETISEMGIYIPYTEKLNKKEYRIEGDWSSASYHYSFCAVLGKEIELKYLFANSTQGDKEITTIYQEYFGIETQWKEESIVLRKRDNFVLPKEINIDLIKSPDIAQTILVTAMLLKIKIKITGLKTLKIKETDRIIAMKQELEKCGARVIISEESIEVLGYNTLPDNIFINTYNDHRVAMSFAPVMLFSKVEFEDENVVIKSYPNFWEDIQTYIEGDK